MRIVTDCSPTVVWTLQHAATDDYDQITFLAPRSQPGPARMVMHGAGSGIRWYMSFSSLCFRCCRLFPKWRTLRNANDDECSVAGFRALSIDPTHALRPTGRRPPTVNPWSIGHTCYRRYARMNSLKVSSSGPFIQGVLRVSGHQTRAILSVHSCRTPLWRWLIPIPP